MDDDDNDIIPYETSPTLTVNQCVIHMLDKHCKFSFMGEMKLIQNDLYDYLYELQDIPDRAHGNARYKLYELNQNDKAPPDEIKAAEKKVEFTKTELVEANQIPDIARQYYLLLNHEISRARLGKRNSLDIDEVESARTGQVCIDRASFLEWLEGIELDDNDQGFAPIKLPIQDDAFDREMELTKKQTESLFLTLGLLVSLFAEASNDKYGTGMKPNIINIAEKIDKHGKRLNKGKKLVGQGKSAVKNRINVALSALYSSTLIKISF